MKWFALAITGYNCFISRRHNNFIVDMIFWLFVWKGKHIVRSDPPLLLESSFKMLLCASTSIVWWFMVITWHHNIIPNLIICSLNLVQQCGFSGMVMCKSHSILTEMDRK